MKIITSLPREKQRKMVEQLFKLIKDEPNLSLRSKSELKKYLAKQQAYLFFDGNNLMGFLFFNFLSPQLKELHGLYLKPSYRNKGYADKIIKKIIADHNYSYLGATFLPKIVTLTKKYGFKKISFNDLTLKEKINFIKPRLKIHRLKEVLRHNSSGNLVLMRKK